MRVFPAALERLTEQFAKLPGIGGKTAQRLAFYLLSQPQEEAEEFADALLEARKSVHLCPVCQNLTDRDICPICEDEERDHGLVCVVAEPKDVVAMERAREYHGVYHVLHGVISPLNQVGPDDLRIRELLERVGKGGVREVIMATNPDTEGEATAMYLSRLLRPLEVRVTLNQIDDLIGEIDKRVKNDDKVLVTTITKRMAEELSKYFDRVGVRNRYIHSDVDTLERIQILEDLRAGMFDVLVGVNLLREGLDLPEVALVAILDADKEGFLRNVRSLTQIAGRAARHSQGNVILYADTCTDSMRYAIEQSNRRREKQVRYNMEHEMLPRQAQKSGSGQSALLAGRVDTSEVNMTAYSIAEDHYAAAADVQKNYTASENIDALIDKAREEMERAAKSLDFLAAAKFRDRMYELQKLREENRNQNSQFTIHNS